MKSAFLSCFTFTLFLFGIYSVTLNILQGLNGLLCFSSLENKLVLKDKSVSQIITSGFPGNDGEFSNYVNPIEWHCNSYISELNLRRLNCNNSLVDGNSTTICSFSSNETSVQYKVYCDKIGPTEGQLFQFSVNPNGVNLVSDIRSYQNFQGHNGTWVEIEIKTKICSLNRRFYILFISTFTAMSAFLMGFIFMLNLSFEMKGLLNKNMNFLEQFLINQGFLTHCNPFGKSILINEIGEKSWLVLKKSQLTSTQQKWTKINKGKFDINGELEFNGVSQNYLIKHMGNGISKIIHSDNQGYFEYKEVFNRKKMKFLYIYTVLKINQENIDVNGHYPNLEDILKFGDEFSFVKGRNNDRVAGIKVSSAMIELGTNRSDLILHFNEFWGHFSHEVFSKVMKGNRMNPDKTVYKNTSWKLYLSDVYKHMALKEDYKIKKFCKSSALNKINSMEEREIISSEINTSSKEFMKMTGEDFYMKSEKEKEKEKERENMRNKKEEEDEETLQKTLSELDYIYKRQPVNKPHEIVLSFKTKEEQSEEVSRLTSFNGMVCDYTPNEELNYTRNSIIEGRENLELLNFYMEKGKGIEKEPIIKKRSQKIKSLKELIQDGENEIAKHERYIKAMGGYMFSVEPCAYDQVINHYLSKPKKLCEINFVFKNDQDNSGNEIKDEEIVENIIEDKIDENKIVNIHSGFKLIMKENIRGALNFKISDKLIEQYLKEFEDVDKGFIKELVKCSVQGSKPGVREFSIESSGERYKYFSRPAKHLKGIKTIYRAFINHGRRRGKKARSLTKKKKAPTGLKKFFKDLDCTVQDLETSGGKRIESSDRHEVINANDLEAMINRRFNMSRGEMYQFYWISMIYIRKFFIQKNHTGEKEVNKEKYYETCKDSIKIFIDINYRKVVEERLEELFNQPK